MPCFLHEKAELNAPYCREKNEKGVVWNRKRGSENYELGGKVGKNTGQKTHIANNLAKLIDAKCTIDAHFGVKKHLENKESACILQVLRPREMLEWCVRKTLFCKIKKTELKHQRNGFGRLSAQGFASKNSAFSSARWLVNGTHGAYCLQSSFPKLIYPVIYIRRFGLRTSHYANYR